MVSSTIDSKRHWQIVIRPNRSLTRRQLQLVFLGIATFCLGIASVFAVLGMWPVLPFAGAEVIAVGVGFYLSAMGGREMEVVSVDSDKVAVEKGRRQVRQRWELQRAWAQILASDGNCNGPGRRFACCRRAFAGTRHDS
jgi:uncharacterized membrane protein